MARRVNSFEGQFAFLSNFFDDGEQPTVEHIFQSMKTTDWREQVFVLGAPSPGAAKRRGRKVTLRPDWEYIKIDVMEACLREKFKNPTLRRLLLDTGDAELIEGNYWNDTFWGVCRGQGRNELGKLLMKLRTEFGEDDG